MDVIEATRELGKAIQQDEAYISYMLCKEKNDNDTELQDMIGEFNLIRMNMNTEYSKGENKDDDKIKEFNDKLKACYDKIMSNENMVAFENAKKDMDMLLNKINGMINLCVEGENPETVEVAANCTGSCESCAGCH